MSIKPTKNQSKLLYLKAKALFEQAKQKFDDGSIKSEPGLIQNVFQSFQDFFTSLDKPVMIPRYAVEGGPLWSEDFNNMMDEIRQDLEILFEEIDLLGRALYTDFNHQVVQHDILEQTFNTVKDKLMDLQIYTKYSTEGILQFGRDDFLNTNKIDFDRISGNPLVIQNGVVTLPTKGEPINVARNATVTIVTGNKSFGQYIIGSDSNGFPGNNTEVSITSDPLISNTETYSFISRDNNHGNYGAVIDGDPNTWFEYERVNLRDQEKISVAKNLGWEYRVHGNQTITYASDPEDGILRLHLQMILEKEEIINQINVKLYVPPNYGARPAIIKDILVSDGKEAPHSIFTSDHKEGDTTFHFPPTKAKVISFLFEQPYKYFTDIGHIYYEQKMQVQNQRDYVFDTLNHQNGPKSSTRINGPLIDLESLGLKVNVGNTDIEVYYPPKKGEGTGYSINDILNQLTSQVDLNNVDMGIERFEGWRWCIGIQEIEVLSSQYETSGELVTQPFYFDKPLDKISLSVNATFPELFNNPTMNYDWIQYFISIDDGGTWHPITPLEHEITSEDQPPKIYTIHQVDQGMEINDEAGYLESPYPVYSLRLKILFQRPDESDIQAYATTDSTDVSNHEYITPTLTSYLFQTTTKELNYDSFESTESIPIIPTEQRDSEPYQPPQIPDPPSDPGDVPPPQYPPDEPEPPVPVLEPDPDSTLQLTVETIEDETCLKDPLHISGAITSNYPLVGVRLLINENLIKEEDLTSSNATEYAYNWTFSPEDIQALGYGEGDTLNIKVEAEDTHKVVDVITVTTLIMCEEEVKNTCYAFDSLIISYYNTYYQEIQTLEITPNMLPYEFDNGTGTLAVVGWDQASSSASIVLTHLEPNDFLAINGIGVNYIDLDNNPQTKWSDHIIQQTANVQFANQILSDPSTKDSSSWVNALKNGDTSSAPGISQENSYVTVGFDNDWNTNQCGIDLSFDPNDYDVSPPEIIINTKIDPSVCYDDVQNGLFRLNVTVRDKESVESISAIYNDGLIFYDTYTNTPEKTVDIFVPVTIPEPLSQKKPADIVFVFDTSGSMTDNINNMKNNLNHFISYLNSKDVDAYMGYVNSNRSAFKKQSLIPSTSFNLNNVTIDGGGWEGQAWGQLIDPKYGVFSFLNEFRQGAARHAILITDTTITAEQPSDLIQKLKDNNIIVSIIRDPQNDQHDYDNIPPATGGLLLDINNTNFGAQLDALADQIANSATFYYPDTSTSLTIAATDNDGHMAQKDIVLHFVDCK